MTEIAEGASQGQETSTQPVVTQEAPQSAASERVFKQSEVNALIGREKHEAVERYKRQQEQRSQQQQPAQEAPSYQPQGGFTENDYRRMAAEEAQKLHKENMESYQRQQVQQDVEATAKEFYSKMNPGKEKYSDFDNVIGKIDFSKFANSVYLATKGIDNTMDVMYHLAKKPLELAGIEALSKTDPNLAYAEMMRVSQSIKDNESASSVKVPNAPLSQLKPSNTGTDNGAMSVGDYRKKYRI